MVRLKDIGDVAGVSIRTVARALKDEGRVSAEMKAKIRTIADDLGYRPDPLAQALRTGCSKDVLMVAFTSDELKMAQIESAESVMFARGYSSRLIHVARDEASIKRAAKRLRNQRIAGLIVDGAVEWRLPVSALAPLRALGLPMVLMGHLSADEPGSIIDRQAGMALGVRHLYDRGHREIAYLGLANDPPRVSGYRSACQQLGIQPVFLPYEDAKDRFAAGRAAVSAYLKLLSRPAAIQAYSDEVALGFLAGLHDHNLSVPEDVALVGFDNRQAAAWSAPPLTTIAQPCRELGARAAEILLTMIKGKSKPDGGWCEVIEPQLIRRETT